MITCYHHPCGNVGNVVGSEVEIGSWAEISEVEISEVSTSAGEVAEVGFGGWEEIEAEVAISVIWSVEMTLQG